MTSVCLVASIISRKTQEAVGYIVGVNVVPSDRPPVVDAIRKGTVKRTWGRICAGRLESRELAFWSAQEAVVYVVRIKVDPRDRPPVVEADGTIVVTVRALGAHAGREECRVFATWIAKVAVNHIVRVSVVARDRAKHV